MSFNFMYLFYFSNRKIISQIFILFLRASIYINYISLYYTVKRACGQSVIRYLSLIKIERLNKNKKIIEKLRHPRYFKLN